MRPAVDGVLLRTLVPHLDERGVFTELYRDAWFDGPRPIQWNAVSSAPNTLRGLHCHIRHADVVTVVHGAMVLGLHDLRPDSPTSGLAETITIEAFSAAVAVPPGVAHGFYFADPSLHVYAVSEYFDPADELGCRWDDPESGIDWPCTTPLLSERDASAGSFSALRDAVRASVGRGG